MRVIHTQELADGVLTVFENGDYAFADRDRGMSLYYPSGTGPYGLQVLAQRAFSIHRGLGAAEEGRGTRDRVIAGVGRRTSLDEDGVPLHMRPGVSLSRGVERMGRDPAGERALRRRLGLALQLAQTMARMHARLRWLIARGGPRFVSIGGGDGTQAPGAPRTVPSELQLAIDGGLIVEGPRRRLSLADERRGVGNDILDLLAGELPGFLEQYDLASEREERRITDELLDQVVLAVVEILTTLVTVAGPAIALARRTYAGAVAAMRRSAAGTMADDVDAIIATSDVPAGAIDASRAVARRAPQPRPGVRAALPEPGAPPAQALPARPSPSLPALPTAYRGPAVAGAQETLVREVFGAERLRDLLAGFRLLDESLPEAIERVVSRTFARRGRPPAVADARLAELRGRLDALFRTDRAPGPGAALTAEQRTQAIAILREARTVARGRWNTLRRRLWRDLYQDPDVVTTLRMLERDRLVRLPRGFPHSGSPPVALGRNRDGIIWARTAQGATPEQIGGELGLSADRVRRHLVQIRARMASGRPAPTLDAELPLNLDHITPVQLNPFNFFHPANLRVLNASYNDTFLRLYQLRSAFPMTSDPLEAWIRAFGLYVR